MIFSLIWGEWEGGSAFDGKLSISPSSIQCCFFILFSFFFFGFHLIIPSIFLNFYSFSLILLLNFYLSISGIRINLYNLHFLYIHFSSRLNKVVLYSFTFPPSLNKTPWEKNKISFISTFHFFPLFFPSLLNPNQTDLNFCTKDKFCTKDFLYYYYYYCLFFFLKVLEQQY